jgi:hypothetical protein
MVIAFEEQDALAILQIMWSPLSLHCNCLDCDAIRLYYNYNALA